MNGHSRKLRLAVSTLLAHNMTFPSEPLDWTLQSAVTERYKKLLRGLPLQEVARYLDDLADVVPENVRRKTYEEIGALRAENSML